MGSGSATGIACCHADCLATRNLHFTGDFHAIGAAHNLLSALIDNHIHWENDLNIDPRRITWKRVVDMNDRSLRDITCGLGGTGNGIPRQSGFDITVASEIMAVFCLASDLEDLENRIGNIVFAYTRNLEPVEISFNVFTISVWSPDSSMAARSSIKPKIQGNAPYRQLNHAPTQTHC